MQGVNRWTYESAVSRVQTRISRSKWLFFFTQTVGFVVAYHPVRKTVILEIEKISRGYLSVQVNYDSVFQVDDYGKCRMLTIDADKR